MNFAGVKAITIPEGDVRSIAIGGVTVWEKSNPLPYDAEVEYIEGTGTQYVDTGIVVSDIGRVSFDFEFTADASNQCIIGSEARSGSSNAQKERFYGLVSTAGGAVSGGYIDFGNMSNSRLLAAGAATGMRLVVDHDVNVPSSTNTDIATAYVFATSNQAGTGPTGAKGRFRIYSLFLEDKSDTLVRSFVPVRVGTVGYLYDRANPNGGPLGNGLYGSATSTPLVAGPDKNGG